MRIAFAIIRVLVAAAIVAAIVAQLLRSLSVWPTLGVTNISISVTNFFSFFTIQSNAASAVVLLIGAFFLLGGKGGDPRWFNVLRACVVTYMGVTGIVYNLLLRNIELPQGSTVAWSNEVLHVVAPVWLIIDWLFAPGRRELVWRTLWIIVIYPIVWVGYTLVRGPFTPNEVLSESYWYPYPFLNPNLSANGYLSVAFYVILIAVFIMVVGAGAIWISKRSTGVLGRAETS